METKDPMAAGLALLNRLAGVKALDRFGLRKPVQRGVYRATKTGFRTVAATSRTFTAATRSAGPARLTHAARPGLFDLTPTDEQQLIRAAAAEFAAEQLRPVAAEADATCEPPDGLLKRATAELGISFVGIPAELGGAGTEQSTVTNALITEALAHGDMGLAVALLAPSAVSNALVRWGDAEQQATYLPSFATDTAPRAALAVMEPQPLFDPLALRTTARRVGNGFQLDGVKSLVPGAATAELFVVAADIPGEGPALFLLESSTAGITIAAEPAMGLRPANLGQLQLDRVRVAGLAKLAAGEQYRDCLRLARLGWAALAVGTAQAVLDYVIPYVNDRQAFGEPISNRQSVAFLVADIGIELEGMRLATYRAASRAEQGKPFARETALARTLTAEYGMKIGSDGVQLLGGHGFVKEHPVERWYRDLRAAGLMEGGVML